jgi:hypothetical protein
MSTFGTVTFALPLCAKKRPKSGAASQMSVAESNREVGEHSDAKKRASAQFGTDRTPEALYAHAPGGKNRHEGGYIFG